MWLANFDYDDDDDGSCLCKHAMRCVLHTHPTPPPL